MDHAQSSGSVQSSVKPQPSPFKHTSLTLSVLQAEAGLVALSHLGAVEAQQVIVSEYFHAVVVPGSQKQGHMSVSETMTACKRLPELVICFWEDLKAAGAKRGRERSEEGNERREGQMEDSNFQAGLSGISPRLDPLWQCGNDVTCVGCCGVSESS